MKEEDKAEKRKKKRKKKKRRKKHYLLKLLLFIVLCVGLYYFLTSDFFDITKIEAEQMSHFTEEQIVELSKIKKGENLFQMSAKDAENRLLAEPYIKGVKLQRKLPGTVVITVNERVEYAAVPYGEEYILIDCEAVVLERVGTAPELPLLTGMTVKTIEPGEKLEVEEKYVLEETLGLLSAMEESDLYFKKIEISDVRIRAYIYDNLICEGTPKDIMKDITGKNQVKQVIYWMYQQGIERGVIKKNGDTDWAFSPLIE